jgi:hypothetical protein
MRGAFLNTMTFKDSPDLNAKFILPRDNAEYLFYTGTTANGKLNDFRREVKEQNLHREGADGGPPGTEVRPYREVLGNLQGFRPNPYVKGPDGNPSTYFQGAVNSFIEASEARKLSKPVRYIASKKDDPNSMPGSYWHHFEAYELTRPGTQIPGVWRYNADENFANPNQIWRPGDAPLGVPPDFRVNPAEVAPGVSSVPPGEITKRDETPDSLTRRFKDLTLNAT